MTLPHATLYRGALDPVPVSVDDFEDWTEFVESLRDLVDREYPDKLGMLAWSPARLAPVDRRTDEDLRRAVPGRRARVAGPYRHLRNVESVHALVIDVDRCVLADLVEAVEALETPAIVYTSPSDDPTGPEDARRVRVIAPASRVIKPGECRHTRIAFAEALGLGPGSGVEGALDAAKIFFAGRLAGTTRREFLTWG